MRADLHLHTRFSVDSLVGLEKLLQLGTERRLGCIAVTDHNTIEGAIKLRRMNPPFQVIVGEEITTRDGEVIALFLGEKIPPGLDAMETIAIIHDQGGLAVLPHPCDRLRHHVIRRDLLYEVTAAVDLVEGFNGRTVFNGDDRKAESLGRSYGKPLTAGSDRHTPWEVGHCGLEMRAFNGSADFLEAVREAEYFGSHSPTWVHMVTKAVKYRNRHRKD